MNYSYARKARAGRYVKRVFTPRVQDFIWSNFSSGTAMGRALEKPGVWIDTAYFDVPHFGWGWCFTGATNAYSYQIYLTYYVEYKNLKDANF